MNNFIKSLRALTNKVKTYKCSDIEVRVYRTRKGMENYLDKYVAIYTRETINASYYEVVKRVTNIEDKKDVIDYKLLGLPAGRAAFGRYLYPESLDKTQFDFYNFRDLWYKIFGEYLSSDRSFTIEELQGILQIFREKIDLAKYQCLYELKYKDSFQGEKKFKGSIYFGGIPKENTIQYEQLKGEDGIQLEEIINANREDDRVFELIDLDTVYQSSRIYDVPYFTKDALRRIIELREKEKGVEK